MDGARSIETMPVAPRRANTGRDRRSPLLRPHGLVAGGGRKVVASDRPPTRVARRESGASRSGRRRATAARVRCVWTSRAATRSAGLRAGLSPQRRAAYARIASRARRRAGAPADQLKLAGRRIGEKRAIPDFDVPPSRLSIQPCSSRARSTAEILRAGARGQLPPRRRQPSRSSSTAGDGPCNSMARSSGVDSSALFAQPFPPRQRALPVAAYRQRALR